MKENHQISWFCGSFTLPRAENSLYPERVQYAQESIQCNLHKIGKISQIVCVHVCLCVYACVCLCVHMCLFNALQKIA